MLGIGPLGLCHVIKARLLGSGSILATDRFRERLAMVRAFGAGLLLDTIVSHRFPIERAEEAVQIAATGAAMKVVIAPELRPAEGEPNVPPRA